MSSSRKPAPSSSSSSETVCKCFFAMARLYPGKNNAMLDSFLELKMENEKLRERLAEIYQEIEGDNIEAGISGGGGPIMDNNSTSTMGSEANNEPRQISGYPSRLLGANQQQQQPQPIQPSPSNPYAMSTENEVPKSASSASFPSTFYNYPSSSAANPYSQQNLQQIQPNNNNNKNQYSIADASTSQRGNTISQDQLLVSSAGLIPSSGNTYGALGIGISPNLHRNNINNNASGGMSSNQYTSNNSTQKGGTAAHNNNSADYGDTSMRDDGNVGDSANKKKKQKKQRVDEGEFVCRDCGTVDSPEWRRGPQGPKTLCNAVSLLSLHFHFIFG